MARETLSRVAKVKTRQRVIPLGTETLLGVVNKEREGCESHSCCCWLLLVDGSAGATIATSAAVVDWSCFRCREKRGSWHWPGALV